MQEGSGWKPGRMGLWIVELRLEVGCPQGDDARAVGRRAHEARARRVVGRNIMVLEGARPRVWICRESLVVSLRGRLLLGLNMLTID